jgi:hypothetical protein
MALVVEDGTLVTPNANSYVTLDEIRAYALARNITLSDDDEVVSGQGVQATDYLETFRAQYKGDLVVPTQPLAWPRVGAIINDVAFPSDDIPVELMKAQCQLVCEQARGVVLQPTFVYEGRIKRKKIDRLETEWFDGAQTGNQPSMPMVDALLTELLNSSSAFALHTVRV